MLKTIMILTAVFQFNDGTYDGLSVAFKNKVSCEKGIEIVNKRVALGSTGDISGMYTGNTSGIKRAVFLECTPHPQIKH